MPINDPSELHDVGTLAQIMRLSPTPHGAQVLTLPLTQTRTRTRTRTRTLARTLTRPLARPLTLSLSLTRCCSWAADASRSIRSSRRGALGLRFGSGAGAGVGLAS